MELVRYTSKYNHNLFIFYIVLALLLIVAAFIDYFQLVFFYIIPSLLLLIILFLVLKWARGKRKILKLGDGDYIFTEDGIETNTKGGNIYLPYQNIQWINFSYTNKYIQAMNTGVQAFILFKNFRYFVGRTILEKIMPTPYIIEMKLSDIGYVNMPVPPKYINEVTQILQQKTGLK